MQPFLLQEGEKLQKVFSTHPFVLYRFGVVVFLLGVISLIGGYFLANMGVWFCILLGFHLLAGWGYFVTFRFQTSKMYVTDMKILYVGGKIFSPKIQEIPLSSIQNISFLQKGMFVHMFGFGDLTFETEHGKFTLERIENIEKTTKEIVALLA